LDRCCQILDILRPRIRLREPHYRPGLTATPRRIVFPALIRHLSLWLTGPRIEVYEVVGGEIRSQDFVDDGVGVLGCDVDELLVVLDVADEVEEVEIWDVCVSGEKRWIDRKAYYTCCL